MQIGFSNVMPIVDVDFLVPTQVSQAPNPSLLGASGLNYSSRHYLSEGGFLELDASVCTQSQEDIYAGLSAPMVKMSSFQEAVRRAHSELVNVLGAGQASAKAMERETLLNSAATKAKIIHNKRNLIARSGEWTKYLAPKALGLFMLAESSGAFSLKIGSIPRHGEPSDFRGIDVGFTTVPFQNLPFAFCVSWLGGELIKGAHDWLQPSYMTNLQGSLKEVSLLAEDVRRVGLDASNARLGGDAAARLVQAYGEHGRSFLEGLMNEVDRSAYNYLLALKQSGPAVSVDQLFAQTGVSSAALQLSAARLEEARFIHTFTGREPGGRAVVREWKPSSAFADLGSNKWVAFDPQGKSVVRLNRVRADFSEPGASMKVWDYSRSLEEGLQHIHSKAKELYALDASPIAAGQWKTVLADLKLSKTYDERAMYRLALALEDGKLGIAAGSERASLAKQLYLPAALQGDKDAQYRLGALHAVEHGFGWQGKKNDQQAVNWLTKAANQDHSEALGLLGVMHHQGRTGLPLNQAKLEAYYCCERAIEAGVSNAELLATFAQLCKMRSRPDQASSFYQRAALLNHPSALLEMGLEHVKHQRFDEAATCFRSAKAKGNMRAAYYLGELYANQQIAPPEGMSLLEAAAMSFDQAAQSGDIDAHFKMGLLLLDGWNNLQSGQPDYLKAAYHFECASKANHAQAKFHLASLYAERYAVPMDGENLYQTVFLLLNEAELLGCGMARLPLAKWLSDHAVLPKAESNQRIVALLQSVLKSSKYPNPSVAYKLGMMYAKGGEGLPSGEKAYSHAKKLLQIAVQGGLSEAQADLDALVSVG